MIANGTERMTFNLFIRELTVGSDSFPLEVSAGDIFLNWEGLPGPPSGGGFDSVRVCDDTIVLGSIFVDDSRVLFIDEVLFTEFKLELVRGVGEESQVNYTKLMRGEDTFLSRLSTCYWIWSWGFIISSCPRSRRFWVLRLRCCWWFWCHFFFRRVRRMFFWGGPE